MTNGIVAGVDGGGTSTRVALCSLDGEVLGVGESGPGNYHNVGIEAVGRHVGEAWHSACRVAGIEQKPLDAAYFGFASVVTAEDRATVGRMAAAIGIAPPERIGVDHDLRIALAGSLAGQPGIVVIAGTGTSCFGRSPAGSTWRAGGWGAMLDDLGGSGWMGLQAMIAAVKAYDGRGPKTSLLARVTEALELDDFEAIMYRVDGKGLPRKEQAELAKLVTAAAAEGDVVALEIINRGAHELAMMVATVDQRLSLSQQLGEVPVAVTGGLVNAGDVFMDPLREVLARCAPHCSLVVPQLPPVLGAAWLAIELTCDSIEGVRAHMLASQAALV
jgi:N-acetylglucosamine kinase-like BadF-type ATPase